MFPLPAWRGWLAAMTLALAGCSTTRPLPKYERPLPHTQHQTVRTTAYTHTESDHLEYGQHSALGDTLQSGAIKSAAADWSRWPAGTLFQIQETGELYQVDDYGWALAGTNTIDLYKPTRQSMNDWGVRRVHLEIQQWGDRRKSLSVLSGRTKYAHVRRMVAGLRSDEQPFEPLAPPTPTPPLDTMPPSLVNAPRAQLASAGASAYPSRQAPPVNAGVRKPFRP
jgi:3D (Asp-Asp-Asp) domain-containing protein